MKHTASQVTIFKTNDYDRFKMLKGNRSINEGKVKRIIAEIEGGNDMLRYYPIQVQSENGHLNVLDGQHRYFICKKLKRPVHYILVEEEKSMPDIAKINTNTEKWKAQDYINCYIKNGNKHYSKLQEFILTYHVSVTDALMLLEKGVPGQGGSDKLLPLFQHGMFQVRKEKDATEIMELCKKFSAFPDWSSRHFVLAIYRIREAAKIDMAKVVDAFNKKPDMMAKRMNYKEYVVNLEQIVNLNKQKRIVIL